MLLLSHIFDNLIFSVRLTNMETLFAVACSDLFRETNLFRYVVHYICYNNTLHFMLHRANFCSGLVSISFFNF